MNNVIKMSEWKPKEAQQLKGEIKPESDAEVIFAEAEARNKAAKKARDRERKKANEKVKRSYKLKGDET